MKKIIQFSKFFLPAIIISVLILATGITGFFTKGFALGVDFQPGLIQEVRFAPSAFSLRWHGITNAILSFDRSNIYIVISGSGIENRTYTFPFSVYTTVGSLTSAMQEQLEELEVSVVSSITVNTQQLLFSSQGNPYLNNEEPFIVHYVDPAARIIDISEVREAMTDFQHGGISVQSLGTPQDRHFMIRAEDREEDRVRSDHITQILEAHFGEGGVAVLRSDYVGSRFSRNLTDQAALLLGLTLFIILLYVSFRFKPLYAVGAVLAIINDGVVVVTFVIWTQMEFTTSTIAAILTILGYSINNTIVIFDRVRENRRIYPDHSFVDILNISIGSMLGRTIITTFTTMLAVLFLFVFVRGAMQNFALALIVGMLSGMFTTIFISSGIVFYLDKARVKREKRKQLTAAK